jgi:hypothetical protein
MKHFPSIEKLDTAILYTLELASSLSVLLLAFGLIASMANVLTKGAILSNNPTMQDLWAWGQCIAVDASIPGTIIRTGHYFKQKEWVKFWLYIGLSLLLLFTTGIVSNIEAIQQTLNLTLQVAYNRVFIPVEGLIWIRSISIVFLIVAHSTRHVSEEKNEQVEQSVTLTTEPQQTNVIEEAEPEQKALPSPDNCERVRGYMLEYPNAKVREVAGALSISVSTANKWMRFVAEKGRNV